MARETDFLDLYKILGLSAGCDLAEFKQAYRRRVSVLHPDRRGNGGRNDAIAAERLQQLTALYGAAMEFERQHGRLPGAKPVRQPEDVAARAPAPRPLATPAPRRSRRLVVVLAALAAFVWLLWDSAWLPWNEPSGPLAAESQPDASANGTPAERMTATSPSMLELGMDTDAVRALQGDPVIGGADHWEYGPSWIRFENGKVVDWYSSPLNPLRTASAQPAHAHN